MMVRSRSGKQYRKHFLVLIAVVLWIWHPLKNVYSQDAKSINRILAGKFNPGKEVEYQVIPAQSTAQDKMYLHQEALQALMAMSEAAKKEGFNIFIISAFRDFASQKYIWESKFNGQRLVDGKNLKNTYPDEKKRALKILEYSSMPGTSRHHWGTDIDIGFNKNFGIMLANSVYEYGEGLKFYQWMNENARQFGFCQPYKDSPEKRNFRLKRGYNEEKWHWSYKPLSSKYLQIYIDHHEEFLPAGFAGSNSGKELYMDYVRNIHSDCK